MPSKKALKTADHRKRRKEREEALPNDAEGGAPPSNDSMAELEIPKAVTAIDGEDNFLPPDRGDANRILICGGRLGRVVFGYQPNMDLGRNYQGNHFCARRWWGGGGGGGWRS